MTNSNYMNCTNQDLVYEINKINKRPDVLNRYLKNHYNELYLEMVNRTSFLDNRFFNGKSVPILARLYCLTNNITESPICHNPNCNNIVEWRNGRHEFAEHCCWQCYVEDPNSHHKEEHTKLMKYGDAHYNNPEKRVKTAKKNWGDENYCNRVKSKNTCNEKFGGNAPSCSKEIVRKMKETKLERYGDSGFNNHKKSVETCIELYGVENVSQIDGIQDIVKQTNIDKYGHEHYNQSFEYKERYPEIRKNCCKKWILYWNDDGNRLIVRSSDNIDELNWDHKLQFDSSWEVTIFELCKIDNDVEIEYQPKVYFEYQVDGKTFTYHPDFLINGKLFEVKGDQFFRINESTGKEEMFLPWKGKLSDEEYEFKCRKEEAKHQCILKNGVKLLRYSQVKNLSIDMFQ